MRDNNRRLDLGATNVFLLGGIGVGNDGIDGIDGGGIDGGGIDRNRYWR